MQGRSYHPKISPSAKKGQYGSNYILKPDIEGEISNNDSVILSADNKAIFNKIKISEIFYLKILALSKIHLVVY